MDGRQQWMRGCSVPGPSSTKSSVSIQYAVGKYQDEEESFNL